jgi:cell wall-associated NlpC family hydrolase
VNRRTLLLAGTSAAIAAGLWICPVQNAILHLALVFAIAGTYLGAFLLARSRKVARRVMAVLPATVGVLLLLPSRGIDREALRGDYLRQTESYQGVRYVWGGENRVGIDCSGLPRKALRNALLSYGLTRLDGGALRAYLEQWWFDASAKALSEGYRGYTVPVGISGKIRTMDYGRLLPGDLAVTGGGVHVLCYLGNDRWIQADPGVGRVVDCDGRRDPNHWFDVPVTVHRWAVLSRSPADTSGRIGSSKLANAPSHFGQMQ